MHVPFLRPALPDPDLVAGDIAGAVASGQLTKGPLLRRYEAALASRFEVEHVVATSSGTVGLALTYAALGMRGRVIVPSFTFLATVTALSWAGAEPVFVDVDRDTWNLDPDAVAGVLDETVAGIVGVHVFGLPCAEDRLEELAAAAGVPLVIDAAHAAGSERSGHPPARAGAAQVFSTTPTKTLITGEGGFVTTSDAALAERLRVLIEYGNDGTYDTVVPGLNGRLSELHAALGLRSLEMLDDVVAGRRRIADTYRSAFAGLDGIEMQARRADSRSAHKDFTIVVTEAFGTGRDELAEHLTRLGIETRRYFSPAVHRHRAYRHLGYSGRLPVTEWLDARVLSLPVWSGLSDGQVEAVIDGVTSASR